MTDKYTDPKVAAGSHAVADANVKAEAVAIAARLTDILARCSLPSNDAEIVRSDIKKLEAIGRGGAAPPQPSTPVR